jgi:hypothetical protein
MRRIRVFLALVALGVGIPSLSGHGRGVPKPEFGNEGREFGNEGAPPKVNDLMQRKLKYAQNVLEGIALNDFEKIGQNGEDLIRVSKLAEWKILKTPQYELYSNEFRRSADALATRAKEKNLDGAALAYVEMTLTCVRCHKHVREVRMAGRDWAETPIDVAVIRKR